MLIRVKDIVINTEKISTFSIHENERFNGVGAPLNYVIIYFSGNEDRQKITFESDKDLNSFLGYFQIAQL